MKVESQLADFDITTESFGGDIQVVPVSSVTGQGMYIFRYKVSSLIKQSS